MISGCPFLCTISLHSSIVIYSIIYITQCIYGVREIEEWAKQMNRHSSREDKQMTNMLLK